MSPKECKPLELVIAAKKAAALSRLKLRHTDNRFVSGWSVMRHTVSSAINKRLHKEYTASLHQIKLSIFSEQVEEPNIYIPSGCTNSLLAKRIVYLILLNLP